MMSRIMKYIDDEIHLIEQLQSEITGRLLDYNLDKEVSLSKDNKGYLLQTTIRETDCCIDKDFNLHFHGENINIDITDGYQNGDTFRILEFESASAISLEQKFHREIIPLTTKLDFFWIIEQDSFQTGTTIYRGLVKLNLCEVEFHVFTIAKNDKNYLIVDCINPLGVDSFSELAWSVIVSISYVIGRLPQDERFLFSYDKEEMKEYLTYSYSTLRKSISTIYHPTNSNSYSWIRDNKEAEFYYGKVKQLSFSNLSTLAKLVSKSDDFKAMLLLIIEAMGSSLLVMPAGLSVALEVLTEYFYKKEEGRLNPISDKEVASKIKNDLLEVLRKYKTIENANAFSILESKIDNLNAPTNADKLQAPFKQLGIDLTRLDQEVIMDRNDFLHGNINLKANSKKSKKSYSMSLTEISMRLYTLINCVILKAIGYEGYILNHAKLQEEGMGEKFPEPYYREI